MDKLRLRIKGEIVRRNLRQAISLAHTLPDNDFQNDLIVLESRVAAADTQFRQGLISREDYDCHYNAIALAVLSLTDDGSSYALPALLGNELPLGALPPIALPETRFEAKLLQGAWFRKDFEVKINGSEMHTLSLDAAWFSTQIYWDKSEIESEMSLRTMLVYQRSIWFNIKHEGIVYKSRFLVHWNLLLGYISQIKLFVDETEVFYMA